MANAQHQKMTAVFDLEKETKNTVRFVERDEAGPPLIRTLYLQKYAHRELGSPETVSLTVETVS